MELRIGIGLLCSAYGKLIEASFHASKGDKEGVEESIRKANKCIELGKYKFIDGFRKLVELEKKGSQVFKPKHTTAELKQRYDTMMNALDKAKETHKAGDVADALSTMAAEFDPHFKELQFTLLEENEEFTDAIVERAERRITRFTSTSVATSVFLTIAIAIMGLALAFITTRSITKPIIKLKDAADEIGKGKLGAKIEIKPGDEIGNLATSFNRMAKDLHKARDELITAKDYTDEELKRTQAQLVQAGKLSGMAQLGAGVIHELRSPLSGVLILVRSYMRKKDPNSEEYKNLKEMEETCEHMAKIIKDLNAFTRQSKGKGEFIELNCNEVIEHTLSFAVHQLEKRDIKTEKNMARISL